MTDIKEPWSNSGRSVHNSRFISILKSVRHDLNIIDPETDRITFAKLSHHYRRIPFAIKKADQFTQNKRMMIDCLRDASGMKVKDHFLADKEYPGKQTNIADQR